MITDLIKKIETSGKDFFELMNNEFFRKTIKNLKKHRAITLIKLVTTEARQNYLVSEPNYNTTISSSESLLLVEIKKTQIYMNKHVYLGISMLELSKMVMHEFWYDYVKPTYGKKRNVSYGYINENR